LLSSSCDLLPLKTTCVIRSSFQRNTALRVPILEWLTPAVTHEAKEQATNQWQSMTDEQKKTIVTSHF